MQRDERQLLIDISVMYYLEGKTQNEISKELFISRPKVSRLLKKARELNIVDITINYESDTLQSFQNKIKNKFNVDNVVIVKTLPNYEDTLKEMGKAASKILLSELKEKMIIGVSWGKSVRSTILQMENKKINDVKIVELFGAISYEMGDTDMLSICSILSKKIGAKIYPLPAPVYIKDKNTKEILSKNPIIKKSLDMIENCDLILTGLGAIDKSIPQTLWDVYVENDAKNRIIENGGVGFLCAHFFDEKGRFLDLDINKNVMGIRTKTIKNKKMIVVAGGIRKAKAILAALRGGYVNTLVSDEETLKHVLELSY